MWWPSCFSIERESSTMTNLNPISSLEAMMLCAKPGGHLFLPTKSFRFSIADIAQCTLWRCYPLLVCSIFELVNNHSTFPTHRSLVWQKHCITDNQVSLYELRWTKVTVDSGWDPHSIPESPPNDRRTSIQNHHATRFEVVVRKKSRFCFFSNKISNFFQK